MPDNAAETPKEEKPVVPIPEDVPDSVLPEAQRIENIYGLLQRTTAAPTWVPRTFYEGFAIDNTNSRFYWYDFDNNVWRSVNSSATETLDTATNNKDATITNNGADTNYGSEDNLNVRYDSSNYSYNTLMHFTLPAEPTGGGVFSKISLWLKQKNSLSYSNQYIEVHELTQTAWTEAGATWNKYDGTNNWISAGGDFDSTIIDRQFPPGAGYWQEFILYDTANPTQYHNPLSLTWGSDVHVLLGTNYTGIGDTGAVWHSKEAASASDRPYVRITYYH